MSENPVGKAIHQTNSEIAVVRAETRKRKYWGYIQVTSLKTWAETQSWPQNIVPDTDEKVARKFFGVAIDAPVRRGTQGGAEMFAVWRRLEAPDSEPDFYENEAIETNPTTE